MRFLRVDDQHPLTGWHMLSIVFAFFGTIIAVNLVMAFAATGTFPGLVVENSYVASQHYDELLAKSQAQDAAGWQHELSIDEGQIDFRLATAAGTPAADLTVTAYVGRPSTTREDRMLTLTPLGRGRYQSVDALPPGRWELDLEARHGGELVFRTSNEVFVKPEGGAS
jgi:nitrogen fixation protein FixH